MSKLLEKDSIVMRYGRERKVFKNPIKEKCLKRCRGRTKGL